MPELTDVPVLYLDIDGTVREGKDDALGKFVNDAQDVRVFPEAVTLMQNWVKDGGRIVGVSNQGGVGLGILSRRVMAGAMRETNRQTGDLFDRIMICPHAPRDKCECRKPGTWLITKAMYELSRMHPGERHPVEIALFVGDRPEDKECADACNIAFMDAHEWRDQVNAGG